MAAVQFGPPLMQPRSAWTDRTQNSTATAEQTAYKRATVRPTSGLHSDRTDRDRVVGGSWSGRARLGQSGRDDPTATGLDWLGDGLGRPRMSRVESSEANARGQEKPSSSSSGQGKSSKRRSKLSSALHTQQTVRLILIPSRLRLVLSA